MSEVKCTVCILCGKLYPTPIMRRGNYYYYHCYCPECAKAYEEALL